MTAKNRAPSWVGQSPPHDLDAEADVLARLIWPSGQAEAWAEVGAQLLRADFYSAANGLIFEAVRSLRERGDEVTPFSVNRLLRDGGLQRQAGGPRYLASLYEDQPWALHVKQSVERLRQLSQARRMIDLSHRIAAAGYALTPEQVPAYLSRAQLRTAELAAEQADSSLIAAPEGVERARRSRTTAAGDRVRTGLRALDGLLTLRPGKLLIVAGRPGMGKSSLAGAIARNIAERDACAVVSLEMGDEELFDRWVAAEAYVDLRRLQADDLGDNERERIRDAEDAVGRLGLLVHDGRALGAGQLHALVSMFESRARLMGRRLSALVIDYLQLMAGDRRLPREQQIADISRSLKLLARSENLVVIALSQLNRKCEERTPPRPQLNDLRESGAIEQDADAIVMMYRPEYYARIKGLPVDPDDEGICEVFVSKQRNGPTGRVMLRYMSAFTRFEDLS